MTSLILAQTHGQPIRAVATSTTAVGVGLANGFWFALTVSFLQAAWGAHAITRCWLSLRGRVPLRLTSFLADAHERRGVLRQVGAVYQFRHAELQRRLASRP